MRLLYIVPQIKCGGGVARVLSVKANYFVEKYGWEVHILSQNEAACEPFYQFHPAIVFHQMKLEGNPITFFFSFYKNVNQKINQIQADLILIADNGLKAYTYPFILKTAVPLVLECHTSRFVEDQKPGSLGLQKLKYWFKNFAADRFSHMVVLSPQSQMEWNVKNTTIIANPNWTTSDCCAKLNFPRAIAIARDSYEKGLDRLLEIWSEILQIYPDWSLDIYTDKPLELQQKTSALGISAGIRIMGFVADIEQKYLEASFLLVSSRTEAFSMVLIEAMSMGLPAVAYDCPIGPRAIIVDGANGFLISDGDRDSFVEKVSLLIDNPDLRSQMGVNARESSARFELEKIMNSWRLFLEKLLPH